MYACDGHDKIFVHYATSANFKSFINKMTVISELLQSMKYIMYNLI